MIYFDNAATTSPIYTPQIYHNPSSPHALGIKAERALSDARNKISKIINCASDEIIFTSGGTESNNLAILGYSLSHCKQKTNLISTPYEHPSILAPIQFAHSRGWANASINTLFQTPSGNVLVAISHVNHETGDIFDINTIADSIKKDNPTALIHVDGVQGFCKEAVCLDNIDLYSFSGHKCHGPTGVGGLFIRKGIKLTPLISGGKQENNRRSGTENVSGIVQMAEAAEKLNHEIPANHLHVSNIKAIFISLSDALSDININSIGSHTSPYILNISFLGVKGEILVHALSEKDIYVSMGAACNSRKNSRSALELMGFEPQIAQSAIRLSFSPFNTLCEAEIARDVIIKEVKRLRRILGIKMAY